MFSPDHHGIEDTVRATLLAARTQLLSRKTELCGADSLAMTDADGIPVFSDELDAALIDIDNRRLSEIELALARLEEGNYGRCAQCSDTISPRRLQVIPFAALCIQCQGAADQRTFR